MSIETVILERASDVFLGPGIDAQDADGVEGSSARRRTLILDEEELSRIPGSGERAVPRLGIASGIIRQSSRFAERCSGCDPFAPAWRCIVELEETRAETTQPPGRERTGGCKRQSIMTIRVMARRFLRIFDHPRVLYSSLQKGGDPAAGSPTATLLRLRPSHCARLRPLGPLRVPTRTSGAHSFHGVTGGVYKARERIHRGAADPRLLAIPASCSRVADYNPN